MNPVIGNGISIVEWYLILNMQLISDMQSISDIKQAFHSIH